jgi:hypothetical protein
MGFHNREIFPVLVKELLPGKGLPPAKIASMSKPTFPKAIRALGILLLELLACGTSRAEDLDAWRHSAKISFNTGATGAAIAQPVKNFPLLVRLSGPSRIFNEARSDGADIRFHDADGTPLDRQIERWDKAGLKAEIWVKVPQVDAESDKDFIVCRWGNPAGIMASDGSKVFPAAEGFAGVWHLGEGGIQTRANSVGTGNHALPINYTGNEQTNGIIGKADSLNGAPLGAYLDLGQGFADMSKGFTYTGWVYASARTQWGRFLDLGNGEEADNVVFARNDTSMGFAVLAYTGKQGGLVQANGIGFDVKTWIHVGMTFTGPNVQIYRNGARVHTGKALAPAGNAVRTQNYLGKSNWHVDPYFMGIFDEPEISLVARSPEWFKLAYETQKPGSNVLSFEFLPDMEPVIPEDFSTWKYRRTISFAATNTIPVAVPGIVDFPLLMRFDATNLDFSQVRADGGDLRFADAKGAALDFEIERWDADASMGEIWVRIPKITGDKAQDSISMYWGNGTVRKTAHTGAAFRSTDGFAGVWHLNESVGTESASYTLDAVSGEATGLVAGAQVGVPGVIGKAFRFGGNASHVSIPASVTRGRGAFTISLWAKETAGGGSGPNFAFYPTLFGMATLGPSSGDFGLVSLGGKATFWQGLSAGGDIGYPDGRTILDGKWHHLAAVYNGSTLTLYEGGIGRGSLIAGPMALADSSFAIGASHSNDGTYQYGFAGDIDAVQFSGTARSAAWLALAHATQMEGSTVLEYGPAVTVITTPGTHIVIVPAPMADPPEGSFNGPQSIRLICTEPEAQVFYTLDGSEPDTAKATTFRFMAPVRLEKTTSIKAKAYLAGTASEMMLAVYVLIPTPTSAGDTLKPGRIVNVDSVHWIDYPHQDGKSPVLLTHGPAWNPPPKGFDKVGPPFILSATDATTAFPGLQISSIESMSDLFLYRLHADGRILWTPPLNGHLWIPAAGSYFWARDTLPPSIRLISASAFDSDSAHAGFTIRDNVANPQVVLRIRTGKRDSLGWWSVSTGDTVSFTFPFGAAPDSPGEIRLLATDHARTSAYPTGAAEALTVGRPFPAIASPLALGVGLKWKLVGAPLVPESPLTLGSLRERSAAPDLVGALWRTGEDESPGYELLRDDDTLPSGRGFWLAARQASPKLIFPAASTPGSDSQGFFPIRLRRGWNIVTCPAFTALPWPVSRSDGESYLRSSFKTLHAFNGNGYSIVDTLRPWEGYYVHFDGADTVVFVGPGAGRAQAKAGLAKNPAGAPKGGSASRMELTFASAASIPLKLGASDFAREGIGREDEMSPPPQGQPERIWIERDGAALVGDYVPLKASAVMAWTLVVRGRPQGSGLDVGATVLPEGFQAWAVSPSRGVKYRLTGGMQLPTTGDDTLRVYAGTAQALAGVGDLARGTEKPPAFDCALRGARGGFELTVNLPEAARVDVRIWTADGRQPAAVKEALLGAGRHAWSAFALTGRDAPLGTGVYLIEVTARGSAWSGHRVLKTGLVR